MSQQMKYMHCKSIILDDGWQSWHKILHQFLLAFRHRHGPCYLMYIREQSMTQQRNHNMRIESWNWSFTLTSTYHWFALEQTQEHHRYTVYISRQESCPTPSSPLKNEKRSFQPLVQVYFPYTFQNFETSQFKAWYINLVIPISTEFQNNTETEPKPQIQYRPITRNNTFSYHQKSQCLIKISTSVRLTWSAILSAVLPGATRSLSRSEEHTSELQSLTNLVCRLLLEKKKKKKEQTSIQHTKYMFYIRFYYLEIIYLH